MSGKKRTWFAGSRTRVFWDVVDFPFPKGLAPETMYHYMEQGLAKLGYGGDLSIRAYVDSEVPDKSAYDKAGITIITHQRERDRYMLVDIAWWKVDLRSRRGSKANLVVISKKIKKESILLTLLEEMSNCCNVLAAAPHRPSTLRTSLGTVSFQRLYTSLFPQPIDQSESVRDPPLYYSPLHSCSTSTSSSTPTFSTTVESMPSPCVFWDFSPPKPRIIHRYMNLLGFGNAAMTHVDTMEELVDGYKKAGITIIPRPRGAHTMSVDIVLWAMENPATFYQPRTLVIFSNNVKEGTDFYNALEALRYRNYSVFVLDQGSFYPTPVYGLMHPLGWIMSKEESIGLASLINLDFQNCPIHVFLDVQGLPIKLSRILSVVRKKGYLGKVLFRPYLIMGSGFGVCMRWSHNRDDIASLPTITVRDKSVLVTRMLLDMLFLAMNTDDQPQNVMLITKDTKCDFVMQALERRGFNVIFKPSDDLVSTNLDSFNSLCKSPPNEEPCFHGPRKRTYFDVFPFIIYWLVDDFPSNPNPDEFRYILSSTIEEKGHSRCNSVTAYFDKSKFSDNLIKLYCKAGMRVRFVREDEKITQMALDMTNKIGFGRFNFLVISKPFKDACFDSVVGGLKERGCNVVFETVDYMLTFGSSHWSAKSILDGSSGDPVYWKYLTRTSH